MNESHRYIWPYAYLSEKKVVTVGPPPWPVFPGEFESILAPDGDFGRDHSISGLDLVCRRMSLALAYIAGDEHPIVAIQKRYSP